MPNLSIIPARAVMDRELTPTQLRVLCAIGIHTNKLGGGVWTSVRTLASEAGVAERTVQMACAVLVERGYLTIVARPGRSNLYEVRLDAPPQELVHPTPAIAAAPERPKGTTPKLQSVPQEFLDELGRTYPTRPEPPIWSAVRRELSVLVREGIGLQRIIWAAQRYATHCQLNRTEPKYVKTLHRWLADGMWKVYDVQLVYGRTRDEWKRSGQDVLEFDRLAGATQPEEVAL